jgi:hypothetical protein
MSARPRRACLSSPIPRFGAGGQSSRRASVYAWHFQAARAPPSYTHAQAQTYLDALVESMHDDDHGCYRQAGPW